MILGLPRVTVRPAANIRQGRWPLGSASPAGSAGANHMFQAR